jgi:hypothetical protein
MQFLTFIARIRQLSTDSESAQGFHGRKPSNQIVAGDSCVQFPITSDGCSLETGFPDEKQLAFRLMVPLRP